MSVQKLMQGTNTVRHKLQQQRKLPSTQQHVTRKRFLLFWTCISYSTLYPVSKGRDAKCVQVIQFIA